MTVAEIFERDGEGFFRDRETQVLERVMSGPVCILSTGGGTFVRPENREIIARFGVSVWLRADLEVIWDRVKGKTTRPLLIGPGAKDRRIALDAERRPLYEKAEWVVQSTADKTSRDVARGLADRVLAAQDHNQG